LCGGEGFEPGGVDTADLYFSLHSILLWKNGNTSISISGGKIRRGLLSDFTKFLGRNWKTSAKLSQSNFESKLFPQKVKKLWCEMLFP
jgi:hypothetical protein